MLILKLLRNKPTESNEIFFHFDKFLSTLLVCLASRITSLIAGNIPVIGMAAAYQEYFGKEYFEVSGSNSINLRSKFAYKIIKITLLDKSLKNRLA